MPVLNPQDTVAIERQARALRAAMVRTAVLKLVARLRARLAGVAAA